ncbi:MAG: hypothetical protein ACK2T6_06370 [Anaerolineae bacterium]
MEPIELPNSDSPEVMTQAVSIWLTHVIWEQFSRVTHPEEIEEQLLGVYSRVYKSVSDAHGISK